MQLYYSPFACSLAAHIACREAGLDVELIRTELSSKRAEGGGDLFALNPMGQVPTLVTDDGASVVENAAVLTYLADRAPERLAPKPSALPRYELTRWLSFIGSEIHKKGLWPIFAPDTPDVMKDYARASLAKPLGVVEKHVTGRDVLVGDDFTVADGYLFWALTLVPHAGASLEPHPALTAYYQRIGARPAVRAAVRFEREQRERPFAA